MIRLRLLSSVVLLLIVSLTGNVLAQHEPPAGYYSSATGTGATLKSQLHNIIDGHTIRSYGDARTILQDTDVDPNDPDRMILAYDRVSLDVSRINGSIPGWDSAASWNREHTWPRSRGVGSSGADSSDLHQLRPTTTQVNSDRGSLNFGGAFGQQSFGVVNDGGTKWYPGDADAGMIARQSFYMAVRYDGSDNSTTNLELATGNPGGSQMGDLSRLIEWHYAAAPDPFERRRNDVIDDYYQGNRNPFVDHPELVWSVFVDQQNDSRLSLAGATTGSDGGSVLDVDLGRHYVGQSPGSLPSVTLNKTGSDGTYFEVTGTGLATGSPSLGVHSLQTGQADSATLTLGQAINTAVTGNFTGTLTIDNLDVTTTGGNGRGANDADDLVNLSLEVLNHPIASFSTTVENRSRLIDFGSVNAGSGEVSLSAGLITNLAGSNGPSFAADLDFDFITGTGDTSAFTLDLSPFTNLQPGDAVSFEGMLNTTDAGSYAATYELLLSGEDLPGEQTQTLSLTLMAEVVAGLEGDFNDDGTVNAADYTVWRDGLGTDYTPADYALWRTNFGTTSSTATVSAVPEPTSGLMAMLLVACMSSRRVLQRANLKN